MAKLAGMCLELWSYSVSGAGSVLCPKLVVISHNKATHTTYKTTLDKIHGFSGFGVVRKDNSNANNNGGFHSTGCVCVLEDSVNKDTKFALTEYVGTSHSSYDNHTAIHATSPASDRPSFTLSGLISVTVPATEHDLRWQ